MLRNAVTALALAFATSSTPAFAQQASVDVRATLVAAGNAISILAIENASFGSIGIPAAGHSCLYRFGNGSPLEPSNVIVSEGGGDPVECTIGGTSTAAQFAVACPTSTGAPLPVQIDISLPATSSVAGVQMALYADFSAPELVNQFQVTRLCASDVGASYRIGVAVAVSDTAQPASDVSLGTITLTASL